MGLCSTSNVSPSSKDDSGSIKIRLRYNTFAQLISVAFGATLFLAGILTFTVTKYSPESDLIYRFYNAFNPCSFFDHFPANMVAILGIATLGVVHVIMLLIIWLRRCITLMETPEHERPLSFLLFSACLGPIMFGYLFFVNIFTSNLYDNDEAYTVHNISSMPGNVTLLTRDEQEGISKSISTSVTWHSLWFIFYLAADMLLAIFIWSYASSLRADQKIWASVAPPSTSCRNRLCWRIVRCFAGALYFFGAFIFSVGMSLMIYHTMNPLKGSEPGYRRGFGYYYENAPLLQKIVTWLVNKLKVSLWSSFVIWIPGHGVFALPPSVGIDVTLSLSPLSKMEQKSKTGLHTWIDPTTLLSGCVQVLAVLILITLCFEPLDSSAGGLRAKPWSFIFAPTWLSITGITAFAVYLSLRRLEIMTKVNNGITISLVRRWLASIVGSTLVIVMFFGLWIVIPDFTSASTTWIGSLISILLPIFVVLAFDVHLDKKEDKKDHSHFIFQRVYAFVCLVCGIVSIFSVVGTVLLIVLMSCLGSVFTYHAPLPACHLHIQPSTNGTLNKIEELLSTVEEIKGNPETGGTVEEMVVF